MPTSLVVPRSVLAEAGHHRLDHHHHFTFLRESTAYAFRQFASECGADAFGAGRTVLVARDPSVEGVSPASTFVEISFRTPEDGVA